MFKVKLIITAILMVSSLVGQTAVGGVWNFAVAPATLTDGATITWAIAGVTIANATVTIAGNRTLNITGPVTGGTYILRLVQGSGGSHTLALGTGCTWKVSGGGSGAITPSTAASAIDILAFYYDGTNCYANFATNFN